MLRRSLLLLTLATVLLEPAGPHTPATVPVTSASTTAAMRHAAAEWLATLDPELRRSARFAFDSDERTAWHFIPKPRPGVALGQMDLDQRRAARTLLRTALSDRGYLKVTTVMSLERVLRLMESGLPGAGANRDSERYWLAVFGNPSAEEPTPWGWRLEGHHISLTFTLVEAKRPAAATPLFLGANPAEVRVGPRLGLRALGAEDDRGRAVMASLAPAQQAVATIAALAPDDVAGVPGAPPEVRGPEGLAFRTMTAPQQALVWRLVSEFAGLLHPEIAHVLLDEIDASGRDRLHFAWAGDPPPDPRNVSAYGDTSRHYFRVHGPTFVLEYDFIDPNHVHAVWHSTRDDFGKQTLRRHHEQSHGEAPASLR